MSKCYVTFVFHFVYALTHSDLSFSDEMKSFCSFTHFYSFLNIFVQTELNYLFKWLRSLLIVGNDFLKLGQPICKYRSLQISVSLQQTLKRDFYKVFMWTINNATLSSCLLTNNLLEVKNYMYAVKAHTLVFN